MRGVMMVAVLALATASCSGDEGATDRGQSSESTQVANAGSAVEAKGARAAPCDVIDKASVDAAMGRDAGPPKATGDTMCQYLFEGDRMMDQGLVSLIIHDVPLSSLEPGLKEMNSAMTPMEGIGDRALWTDYGLYVEHGGRSGIYVAGQGTTDEAANKAKTIALAKATANKL